MNLRRLFAFFPLCLVAVLLSGSLRAETWYVRADGGTRFAAKDNSGQCDGKADAAYPGKGTNRHCAFNDVRFLYDDQHTYGALKWVIAGGDTVVIDNTKAWRIGWELDGSNKAAERWCWGWEGGAYGCFNPPIPAGTTAQPTRVLGRNFGHCNAGDDPDKSKMTQLFAGHGAGAVLNLGSTQNVDVECIEMTRHSQCVRNGDPRLPKDCSSSIPLDDYDGSGMYTDNHTANVLLQDLWIHGHTDRGIKGAIGGAVTANRVDIAYNGMAGWDFDDGRGTPSVNAVLRFNHSTIEWSGCAQEYPAVHPNAVVACYGQSNGGYGDAFGTPANDGMDVYIDHSVFRYNTQDGPDFNHIDTGSHKLVITNSLSYGNNGGQFKWGPAFTSVLFANNVAIANCLRLSQPMPGTPGSFDAHLGDYCRAGDAISIGVRQGDTDVLDNNTIVGYEPTMLDIGCWEASCSTSTVVFRNNIVMGYDNAAAYNLGGKSGGPGGFYYQKPIGKTVRSNNLYYGLRNVKCEATELCTDPKFVREPRFAHEGDLDYFNVHLAPDSPARHAGVRLPDLRTDAEGKPRPAAGGYAIGAME